MALPSSGPISIAQIAAELAEGQYNLGYYRGRQYWRGTTPVTISNSPAMSEFYGLQLAPPIPDFPIGAGLRANRVGYSCWAVFPSLAVNGWNFGFSYDCFNGQIVYEGLRIADANSSCGAPLAEGTNVTPFGGLVLGQQYNITAAMVFRVYVEAAGYGGFVNDVAANNTQSIVSGWASPANRCGDGHTDATNVQGIGPAATMYGTTMLQATSFGFNAALWAFSSNAINPNVDIFVSRLS